MAASPKPTKLPNLELEGAATAPILHFDVAPVFGVLAGVGRLTVSAFVQTVGLDGTPGTKQVTVAHLRGNVPAMRSLKQAIDGILVMADGEAASEGLPN